MGITEERIKRITEQAAAIKALGEASADVSGELDALVSDNAPMEAKIQGLEEANARLRERLDRSENHDGFMKLPLDADGVPIRIGDEMDIDGDCMTVLGYRLYNGELHLIVKKTESNITFTPEPSRVRHFKYVKPDSWEKLEEDARKTSCDYASAPLDENGFATCDGCRFQNGGPCHIKKSIDMVERAKKLAGIEKLEGEEQ